MATYYCKYCSIRSSVRAMDGTHLCIDHFLKYSDAKNRLEYLRGEIRAERISTSEILELVALQEYISPDDVELLEWAGVKEGI